MGSVATINARAARRGVSPPVNGYVFVFVDFWCGVECGGRDPCRLRPVCPRPHIRRRPGHAGHCRRLSAVCCSSVSDLRCGCCSVSSLLLRRAQPCRARCEPVQRRSLRRRPRRNPRASRHGFHSRRGSRVRRSPLRRQPLRRSPKAHADELPQKFPSIVRAAAAPAFEDRTLHRSCRCAATDEAEEPAADENVGPFGPAPLKARNGAAPPPRVSPRLDASARAPLNGAAANRPGLRCVVAERRAPCRRAGGSGAGNRRARRANGKSKIRSASRSKRGAGPVQEPDQDPAQKPPHTSVVEEDAAESEREPRRLHLRSRRRPSRRNRRNLSPFSNRASSTAWPIRSTRTAPSRRNCRKACSASARSANCALISSRTRGRLAARTAGDCSVLHQL